MWTKILLFAATINLLHAQSQVSIPSNFTNVYQCKDNDDCSEFIYGITSSAVCAGNYCLCANSRNIRVECQHPPELRLFDGCPCPIENTHCDKTNNTCVCNKNLIPNKSNQKCIPESVNFFDQCEMDIQCLKYNENTVCSNNSCTCQENYVYSGNNCVLATELGGKCILSKQCELAVENSECIQNKCECKDGFTRSLKHADTCLPISDHSAPCNESIQCQKRLGIGGICDSGICECSSTHYVYMLEICVRNISLYDACTDHSDCVNYGEHPSMKCIEGGCICRNEYFHHSHEDKKCVSINSGRKFGQVRGFIAFVLAVLYFVM